MEITTPALDEHGHLLDPADWSYQVAEHLAQQDGLTLTSAHKEIIFAVRDIYQETGDTPPMRLLIKVLRQRLHENIDSRHLYQLFPDGPVRFASKYAGLPKPKHCM
ncbi:MAG: TusE/DsrC/DsvC family sulfur relay protein [Proteobacteria bacterium]|nr:MAG: TusE/DsrC/DsvC family sulfur relay protein [Pseudomonadota bacterium]